MVPMFVFFVLLLKTILSKLFSKKYLWIIEKNKEIFMFAIDTAFVKSFFVNGLDQTRELAIRWKGRLVVVLDSFSRQLAQDSLTTRGVMATVAVGAFAVGHGIVNYVSGMPWVRLQEADVSDLTNQDVMDRDVFSLHHLKTYAKISGLSLVPGSLVGVSLAGLSRWTPSLTKPVIMVAVITAVAIEVIIQLVQLSELRRRVILSEQNESSKRILELDKEISDLRIKNREQEEELKKANPYREIIKSTKGELTELEKRLERLEALRQEQYKDPKAFEKDYKSDVSNFQYWTTKYLSTEIENLRLRLEQEEKIREIKKLMLDLEEANKKLELSPEEAIRNIKTLELKLKEAIKEKVDKLKKADKDLKQLGNERDRLDYQVEEAHKLLRKSEEEQGVLKQELKKVQAELTRLKEIKEYQKDGQRIKIPEGKK